MQGPPATAKGWCTPEMSAAHGLGEPGKTQQQRGDRHLSAGDPVVVKTAALGIRTTIGPMTGLPRQRRLKWIETSGNASITCMAGCKEALNCMN